VDIEHSIVELQLVKDAAPDLRAIPDTVRSSGFTPGWMWVRTSRAGTPAVLRLDTRAAEPHWEPEPRDLKTALAERTRGS